MDKRYRRLIKIPNEPAARMLAAANARIVEKTGLPASAGVADVLEVLDEREAHIDILRLFSVALPPRERVWWACLGGRDIIAEGETVPATLLAAEAWVRKPGDDTKAMARQSMDAAPVYDDLVHCATAAVFADGTMGAGELAKLLAPPGASQAAAFAMNILCIANLGRQFETEAERLIDRAIDIAQGGNGKGRI